MHFAAVPLFRNALIERYLRHIMTKQNTSSADVKQIKNAPLKLAILCMGFYAVSYICRKSFDSNINEIMDFFTQPKSAVGLIGTFFFIAYAVGQVVHGIMCKYYKPRPVIFIMGLIVASMNLLMGIVPVSGFPVMKFIWMINGFSCASFWSLLILTLNSSVAKKHKPMVLLITCFPVSVGTFLSYGISALLSFLHQFRFSFYIGCITMVCMCFIWLIASKPLMDACLKERAETDTEEIPDLSDTGKKKGGWSKAFIVTFSFLAFFAIANNLVRDGVNTWTPSILKETYHMENWVSVLLSVLVPLMSVFGGLISIRLHKIIDNCVIENGILFGTAGIIFAILLLQFSANIWIITLLCLIIISLTMSSVNNIITAIFPMNCEGVNAGTVAGVIDGFCYVGSAVSSYSIGIVAERTGGWTAVFILLMSVCILCTVLAFAFGIYNRSGK